MGEVKISKDEESKNWTNIAVSVSFGAVGAFGAMVFAIFVASRFFDFSFFFWFGRCCQMHVFYNESVRPGKP